MWVNVVWFLKSKEIHVLEECVVGKTWTCTFLPGMLWLHDQVVTCNLFKVLIALLLRPLAKVSTETANIAKKNRRSLASEDLNVKFLLAVSHDTQVQQYVGFVCVNGLCLFKTGKTFCLKTRRPHNIFFVKQSHTYYLIHWPKNKVLCQHVTGHIMVCSDAAADVSVFDLRPVKN